LIELRTAALLFVFRVIRLSENLAQKGDSGDDNQRRGSHSNSPIDGQWFQRFELPGAAD
jgi:hypothetical protein